MRCLPTPPWCLPLLALLACSPALRAEKLVLARSTATSEYLRARMVDGKPRPQTYVFMPGRFLAGNTRDKSLERFSFRALAERLAMDLRKQDFHPAPALAKADLLLVVHWGATAGRNRDSVALSNGFETLAGINGQAEETQDVLDEAVATGDMLGASLARSKLASLASEARQEERALLNEESNPGDSDSAALLGFTAELNREDGTLADQERRRTLFQLTREECYCVVVMAYDAKTLVESKRLKRAWTLRVSINTAGVNFPEALDRISDVASHYFGTRHERVTFAYPPKRNRKNGVRMDDIVVLGVAEP
jgi:hypothetical protein